MVTNKKLITFRDIDGSLDKSRGQFQIDLKRNPTGFIQNTLWPETMLLLISWSVFWIPMLPPFVMLRIATAMIAFLAFVSVSGQANSLLGSSSGTWIGLYS